MLKIAITGGIGSGKSFVCRKLEQQGIKIYDCDSAAKRIMAESSDVKKALIELIGDEAYQEGKLNKPVLAKFILASEKNARSVNGIVHPAVAEDFMKSGYDWMECAILFSSGFDRYVDRVICVTAPRETRLLRIINRDGISREKAEEWIDCQMPQDEVASRSDYIVVNDGFEAVEPQINQIIKELRINKTIKI